MNLMPARATGVAQLQRGVSALSVIVSLLVAAVLLVGATRSALEISVTQGGTSAGQALNQINKALGAYVTDSTRAEAIRAGGAIPGVANILAPTVAELQSLGLLSGIMNTSPSGLGTYKTAVVLLPAGCTGSSCNIATRLWISEPILETRGLGLDIKRLGAMMAVLEGNGGFSDPQSPSTIRGTGGWTLANPDAAARAGIVLAINGFGATVDPNYVRIRDTRDPDLQGGLTVQGNVVSKSYLGLSGTAVVALGATCSTSQSGLIGKTSTSELLICNGSTWQSVSGLDRLVTAGATCTTGQVGRDSNGVLMSCQGGVFKDAAGFPNDLVAGASCSSRGQFGLDSAGRSYLCRGGFWIPQSALSPFAVEMARYVVTDSSALIPKPSCEAGGAQTYDITPMSVSLDLTTAPPYSALEYVATDSGTSWLPRITLKTPSGTTKSGNTLGISALMRVFCTYPM